MNVMLLAAGHPLVHLNAGLNTLATALLVAGLVRIRRGQEGAHGRIMTAAFATSTAFLISYLTYHAIAGSVTFTHQGTVRYVYLAVLASHIVLAATAPFFALASMWYGGKAIGWIPNPAGEIDYRRKHRRLVRWAFPVWMYVSITGVVIYVMLYHLWPPEGL